MVSVHTSPIAQPGTGDAGGMNVYILEVARRLVADGIEVDLFTRATSSAQAEIVDLQPGLRLRHIPAGPYEGLSKEDLPGQLCAFAAGMMRVHTMHTMARVKNLHLADGDTPEPLGREIGEAQVVEAADRLVANTVDEAHELIELYAADPAKVVVAEPGVDLATFTPGPQRQARAALGLPADALVALFVGRIQPLKAPDVLIRAAAELVRRRPEVRSRLVVAVLGGASGAGARSPMGLPELAERLGIGDVVRFIPPVERATLAQWYRAADLVTVPSYSESFGLVALEALACGTPVVAARVGGLPTAVGDGGVLVEGHDTCEWATAMERVLYTPGLREALSRNAVRHASGYGWERTAATLRAVYEQAVASRLGIPINGADALHGIPPAVIP